MLPTDPAYAGQQHYTPVFLKIYDPLVLGFFTRVVWRCPTTRLVEGYQRHVRHRHLDVGPGTGYFLERAGLPEHSPVTLLDPNPKPLKSPSRRSFMYPSRSPFCMSRRQSLRCPRSMRASPRLD